jgi:AmmeMemoRadiSam system protein B
VFSAFLSCDIIYGQLNTCTQANDTSRKRVFLLGPSHHLYLEKAALTKCTHYGTPLGNLPIDATTTAELHKTGQFDWMTQDVDEDEHSLEMHLPYIYKMLSK